MPAFGANPGALRMLRYVPAGLPPGAPLVVVLHGCSQTAASYDTGTGWSTLAERHGFALLLPEQRRANNAHGCFNWFEPGDTARGEGEVASIRSMIAHMVVDHRLDQQRIYITGLSAGGAMTAAMLATYPDLFAGGAIIAGLPYRAAVNTKDALAAMFHCRSLPAPVWGDLVRNAGPAPRRYPTIAIWHGDADTTVTPGNALESAKQWDRRAWPARSRWGRRPRRGRSAPGLAGSRRRGEGGTLRHSRPGPWHADRYGRAGRSRRGARHAVHPGIERVLDVAHRPELGPGRGQPRHCAGQIAGAGPDEPS
ncbi:MAG: PHB depolymerase family esterase [Acetobacteraceae bacterium]